MNTRADIQSHNARLGVILAGFGLVLLVLVGRALDLHVLDREFLQNQGDARYLRDVSIPAHRGMITDRHGEPLAVSTPVDSVWANPSKLAAVRDRWPELARRLDMDLPRLTELIDTRQEREFIYLRRHMEPDQARRVMDLQIPGLALQREYRRYYPTGEVTAHILGFTNIDDIGQEGVELGLEEQLRGVPGIKRVLKDRLGQVIDDVESVREPSPGRDIALSIDRRIQYLTYRELKAAVQHHGAKSASAVVLDATSGEVLAMVNQPAFNPNNREDRTSSRTRNRAVTDVFEPGSTMKPFTVAAGLASGRFRSETIIDTHPGFLSLAGYTIRDHHNYGRIDLPTLIQKSSNVGASRIAMSLEPQRLWDVFHGVGFGISTGSRFPGEAVGSLKPYKAWYPVEQATLSYGYGLSVTALQLTRAYSVLANGGVMRPVSFVRLGRDEAPAGEQVLPQKEVDQVLKMLEKVVQQGGTGTAAQVAGYHVAGKTGTVRRAANGGYAQDSYTALFAGMAPANRPRLVMIVKIDDPSAGEYYGGSVSAPVFSKVMDGALRLLNVPPDDLPATRVALAEEPRR